MAPDKYMTIRPAFLLAGCAFALAACQSAPSTSADGTNAAGQRASIDRHAEAALARLVAESPEAKAEIAAASGYAVFDVSAVNAVLVVGQKGRGVLVDAKSGKRTYMKALRAGTGPGVGYQQVSQVFVFKSGAALEQFKAGGKAGGDVSASATVGSGTVQQSFNPYIRTWQLTDKGFAVQANWGGTAYFVDAELN